MAERQEIPEGWSQASDHDHPAEQNHINEVAQQIVGDRTRSRAEQRRVHARLRLKSIRLKTRNGERTALNIVSQEGSTIEHAGRRLRESMDAVSSRTVRGKQGIVYLEYVPDFKERRRASKLVLRLHEVLRGPKALIQEADPFESSIKPDPMIVAFSKLDSIDRNLFLRATELCNEMIEIRKQEISAARYGLSLEELDAQLHTEAAEEVIAGLSKGPLEEGTTETRDSSREVSIAP
jgi:hypothetical protein